MIIQEAAEMYLETILTLRERTGVVRSVDIAREMGYSKPTVSEQMKKFRENGYVTVNEDGHILLTEKGEEIAQKTWEKHKVLVEVFKQIGVSEAVANEDACRIEHYISGETFDRLKQYVLGEKDGES